MSNELVKQNALAIDLSDVSVKKYFSAWELPKDFAVSNAVFEHFYKGAVIFPDEIISRHADYILNDNNIDSSLLKEFCMSNKLNFDIVKENLEKEGFALTTLHYAFSPAELCVMNTEISGGIIPFLKTKIAYRGVSPMASV